MHHAMTPIMLRITPMIGKRGMTGHKMMRKRQTILPNIMIRLPTISRRRRVKKPTRREMKRSRKIWNFISKDESAFAEFAEIWRNGWNNVRMSESMEKKSVMFDNIPRILWMKTCQPRAYHQKNISTKAILKL